ncbi:hypothetical protein Ndes2526B_g00805 [Nannochloris sp. 'desiccata']|nr:hypothetical protein KSW81_004091 [Chlorella desiccata (nom. nud.)]KAH7624603.1 putative WD repeat-containing protein 75 [Chlorella desiccata (nom. nud.)]
MVIAGGGQLTRRQHLLSRDGRQLLVCRANSIRVYSTATAELLFEMQGHLDEVTCMCLHPKSSTQIYSTSRDGTIGLWDLQSGTRVQSWDVINQPIESIAIVGSSHTTAILTCSWREAQAGRALAFDLSKGAARESRIKLSKPRPLTLSASGNLIATHDRHTILVWSPESFGSSPPLALHHTKAITCVSISPDGAKLAAGDNTGRIIIWHDVAATLSARTLELQQQQAAGTVATGNFDSDDEEEAMDLIEPPAATVHWHAHAVGALVFSTDGAYLLSGGQEAVLVIWDVVSGRRAYLPRLGGGIIGISVCPSDPSRYAIRQSDNTLRIINAAAMTVEASVHGLRPLPRAYLDTSASGLGRSGSTKSGGNNGANSTVLGSSGPGVATTGVPPVSSSPAAAAVASSISNQKQMLLPPPLVMQPGTGLAVIAGPHAVLQWYDFLRDCHVDKLQLSQRNIVSLTEGDAAAMSGVYGAPTEPAATEVVFSTNGATMATVESRPDPAGGGAVQFSLKFWDRVNPSQARYGNPYRLNTLADQPHRSAAGFGAITSLAFHPIADIAATTSDIGEFKLWTRQIVRTSPNSTKNNHHESTGKGLVEDVVSTWRCAAVGTHKNEPLTASAFSSDGSVLALGSVTGGISLWDATQTALLGVLPPALNSTTVGVPLGAASTKKLVFLNKSPLLVACLHGGLAVYNLLTMRCEWSVQINAGVGAVVADPVSSHWAVVLATPSTNGTGKASTSKPHQKTQQQGVVLFNGGDEIPVGAWRVNRAGQSQVPASSVAGTALAFVPSGTPLHAATVDPSSEGNVRTNGVSTRGESPLIVLTGDREYSIATRATGTTGASTNAGGSKGGVNGLADTGNGTRSAAVSGFEAMYGHSAKVGVENNKDKNTAGATAEAGSVNLSQWGALFDAPSHALPSMGTLCPAFLEFMITGGGEKK